ncbi:MAG: rsmA [Candidatus Krumholzibacteriota bacterium]|jgi:16S rRNA (adenine1518-N6/adenine1519-N6)-dimethyltransferase|nr:rsmA [Candidatus Krumholzibacteriota bacterium]
MLGQNFLHDPAIAARIVEGAGLSPEATVIELGAGKGILTRPLAAAGVRLIAVELDRELHAELAAFFGEEHCKNPREAGPVEIVQADFTKLTITGLLSARGLERCVLFGNIPYHLTRDVLFSFLVDEHEMIEGAYLMVQREVGERIVSPPGSRVYGITSVVLQSLYDARPLFRVGPGAFFPRPKVDSIVVAFRPLAAPMVEAMELNEFVTLVKNLFQQRRKTIRNTLKSFYTLSEEELDEIAGKTGVSLDKRPEELGKETFLALSRTVSGLAAAE